MTAGSLFALIIVAVVLQVCGAVLAVLAHRRRAYAELMARRETTDVAAWLGHRPFRVRSKKFEDPARSVCSFVLDPVDGGAVPNFLPGQFLTFRLTVLDSATGGQKAIVRCYSLSDRPGGDGYRVSIKRVPSPDGRPDVPPGLSSSHFHDQVAEGDILEVKAPAGHFHLAPKGAEPVVLVAGGIGVTPMISMAAAILHENPGREIWFVYGVRNASEEAFANTLRAWAERYPAFRLHVSHSRPTSDEVEGRDYHRRGHVDIELLRQTLPVKPLNFYVCGPQAMMESLVPALLDWGVPADRIHYEAFGPASLPSVKSARQGAAEPDPIPPSDPVPVTFARSGRQVTWTGGSLLELAEANGVAVESGCRAGACGMCQTRVERGEVDYDHPPDFDAEPGTCLLCVGRPKTNLVLSA